MRGRWLALLAVAATRPGQQAFAWGATGHEWATGIAIEKLPDDIPAFVRDSAVRPRLFSRLFMVVPRAVPPGSMGPPGRPDRGNRRLLYLQHDVAMSLTYVLACTSRIVSGPAKSAARSFLTSRSLS